MQQQQLQYIPENFEQQIEFFNERKQHYLNKKARILKQSNKCKGYTFGLRRLENNKQFDTPGPGYYSTQMSEPPISYSMGMRFNEKSTKFAPPPLGTYEIKGLDKYGYYTNSKFKNACATLFSPLKQNNLIKSPLVTPGPGDYQLPGSINSKGIQFVSNFKTNQGWVLGTKSLSQRRPYY